jgi:hypothetical protein
VNSAGASVLSGKERRTTMACGDTFAVPAGERFGLRVSGGDNLWSCTGQVTGTGQDSIEERLTFEELTAGHSWPIEENTNYTILLMVQSKVPGQDVSIDVEIPLGSPAGTCTRVSSGLLGVWNVVAS